MPNRLSLKSILNDKVSGSSELLEKLNRYFLQNVTQPEKIRRNIKTLKEKLPQFSAITNYIAKVEKLLDQKDIKGLKIFLKEFNKGKDNSYSAIYNNARKDIINFNKVLTLSNSRTLLEVFKLWHKENKNLKIIVCESRPKNEGLIFAKELAKAGIKVEVITDASINNFIEKADAVIIGADKVLGNGNLVNKTGSRNAAIICKHFRKPFYVLTTIDKFTRADHFKQNNENSDDILRTKDKKITIYNYYFEEIEKSLITKVITD